MIVMYFSEMPDIAFWGKPRLDADMGPSRSSQLLSVSLETFRFGVWGVWGSIFNDNEKTEKAMSSVHIFLSRFH